MADEGDNLVPDSTNDEDSELTVEAIKDLDDVVEAMILAEKHHIEIDNLESLAEIQTRLKCHLTLLNEGNLKANVSVFDKNKMSLDIKHKGNTKANLVSSLE